MVIGALLVLVRDEMNQTLKPEKSVPQNDVSQTLEEIYRSHGERILNMAYRMTGDEETARDLTQEIFLKVYEKISSFRGESQLYTWLYRLAVNHILNYLRRSRRRQWLALLDKSVGELFTQEQMEPNSPLSPVAPSAQGLLERQEREHIVWKLIQTLPVKYRVPLVLYRYEGLSYRDIAEMMNISLSAVETRIHRARKMLVEKLQPWMNEL